MISNEISLVPIDEILTPPDRRQPNQAKVAELAHSIRTHGLWHTVLVNADGTLIAGGHRVDAFKMLRTVGAKCPWEEYAGWTLIPARYAHDVTPIEAKAIELEENIKRVTLDWKDEAQNIYEYHALQEQQNPNWTQDKTAKTLGLVSAHVSRAVSVAAALRDMPEKVQAATSISSAYNILARMWSRAIDQETALIDEIVQAPSPVPAEPPPPPPPAEFSISHTDFLSAAPEYSGEKFNLVHCDFPYGISWDKANRMKTSAEWKAHRYGDDPDLYWVLLETLLANLPRLCYPSAHIWFWLSANFKFHKETREFISSRIDARIDPVPYIWHKSDGKGIIPDHNRGGQRIYETALLISLNDRQVVRPVANLYPSPARKDLHVSEKPEPVLRHFFRMLVDSNTRLLDPTCGSGTAVRAASALGAECAVGWDIDEELVGKANERLSQALRLQKLSKETEQ